MWVSHVLCWQDGNGTSPTHVHVDLKGLEGNQTSWFLNALPGRSPRPPLPIVPPPWPPTWLATLSRPDGRAVLLLPVLVQ